MGESCGRWLAAGAATALLLVSAPAGALAPPAAAAGCTAGTPVDFNGDGTRDLAIADPEATVAGHAEAGLVRISYGGGKGVAELSQDAAGVPGDAETGDRYGHALAVLDENKDGCSDLAVGVPYESLGEEAEAGLVQVIYGAPGGLGTGPAVRELFQGAGKGDIATSAAEERDWFGYALAAGATTSGDPYLVIGVPGEDLDATQDAGTVHYLRGGVNVSIHEESPGVAGAAERDDRFGSAVAASPEHIAVGGPGEAIEDRTFSGAAWVFGHRLSGDGIPVPLADFDQTSGISGSAETGDQFGSALALVPYRPSGAASATHSLLAVGAPGEDSTTGTDTGRVVVLDVTASGTAQQTADISQTEAGVTGVGEDGDYFGRQLAAVNTAPGSVGTASTVLLAVGVPGEDVEEAVDSGSVQIFPLVGAAGDGDAAVGKGDAGLPGTPGPREYLGTSLWATSSQLYVGIPHGAPADRGVYGLRWPDVLAGSAGTVTAWKPGEGGLPAVGRAFGAVVR
ncbi:VCBS repeat-containing protein [Streptomyces sp. NPDC002055]|uniref:VCBS repeat-containing protein n=1 Tax=Streptomyces sp. NPDC002055 TaxID=3154534 RepID=UPI003330F866